MRECWKEGNRLVHLTWEIGGLGGFLFLFSFIYIYIYISSSTIIVNLLCYRDKGRQGTPDWPLILYQHTDLLPLFFLTCTGCYWHLQLLNICQTKEMKRFTTIKIMEEFKYLVPNWELSLVKICLDLNCYTYTSIHIVWSDFGMRRYDQSDDIIFIYFVFIN